MHRVLAGLLLLVVATLGLTLLLLRALLGKMPELAATETRTNVA
jgi:hypothetical protein